MVGWTIDFGIDWDDLLLEYVHRVSEFLGNWVRIIVIEMLPMSSFGFVGLFLSVTYCRGLFHDDINRGYICCYRPCGGCLLIILLYNDTFFYYDWWHAALLAMSTCRLITWLWQSLLSYYWQQYLARVIAAHLVNICDMLVSKIIINDLSLKRITTIL